MPITNEQAKRMQELNKECMQCIEIAQKNFIEIDRKKCLICEVGAELHKLDQDNIDGHNSGRYEKYFNA